MNWQKFQNELAWMWSDPTGANYDRSHEATIKRILRDYNWEIGKMELDGLSKQEQMAFAWKMYKKDFPHLVESKKNISGLDVGFKRI